MHAESMMLTTFEAPVNAPRHPREAEKVSATGAGRLWECVKNPRLCMS